MLLYTIFGFCLALCLPTIVIVYQAYHKLKWESFHQHRLLAEELSVRIDDNLQTQLNIEEERSIAEYQFIMIEGDIKNNYIQRSPLSNYPINSDFSGLLGYFQIDAEDKFSTPVLPNRILEASDYGISESELSQRMENRNAVFNVLSQNKLLASRAKEKVKTEDAKSELTFTQTNTPQLNEQLYENESPQDKIASEEVLASNGVTNNSNTPFNSSLSQAAFDQLEKKLPANLKKAKSENALGRIEDLKLDKVYQKKQDRLKKKARKKSLRSSRKEKIAFPEPIPPSNRGQTQNATKQNEQVADADSQQQNLEERRDEYTEGEIGYERVENLAKTLPQLSPSFQIKMFESEIEPFELSLLTSGHFVVYRRVWQEGKRLIQGFLVTQDDIIKHFARDPFLATTLSNTSNIAIAYQGEILTTYSAVQSYSYVSNQSLHGTLLYKTNLSAPFNNIELVYTVEQLPLGASANIIAIAVFIIVLVLIIGSYLFYRLGIRQIRLTNQQQDFVSSVSHELKTPLTSIRMYGEILKQGWASDEKKNEYYDYIYHESERLTRLINNVLQLAKMTRSEMPIDAKPFQINQLANIINSKVASQIERAGFTFELIVPGDLESKAINIDEDLFTQVIINLVDNALKFSVKSETKQINITFSSLDGKSLQVAVRDYGPGIPPKQLEKVFKLFYRTESELTRETKGTGIGLALVHQLVGLMQGKISLSNATPGAEARLVFPFTDSD